MNATRHAKALVAFFTTAAGSVAQVYADGVVDTPEVLIAICLVGAATAGVWVMPNERPEGEPYSPDISEREPA
jgi:hypothetical protein